MDALQGRLEVDINFIQHIIDLAVQAFPPQTQGTLNIFSYRRVAMSVG
jgi:hypothetical protein